jgi:predicted transcriptional regulator
MKQGRRTDMTDTRSLLAVRVGDLHLTGHSQVEIAEKLDISQQSVSNYLSESRTHWRAELNKSYDEHMQEALASIRRILKATEVGLQVGNPKSVEAATRLVERTAKLLGLDHSDRMNARMVAVEEARAKVMIAAGVALLDHLGLEGEDRETAINVMHAEILVKELV